MERIKKRIAIYGKGGIGKSTIAANLSLLFAKRGYRVALIGCDPKQDTVRLLTGGYLPSILERYDCILNGEEMMGDTIVVSSDGVMCAEVGGPKPGVGCAGRGLILALNLLAERRYLEDIDIVIYDVLGDVVCGGFATPVSKGYANDIYIVSSGEQASLYAANNILRGMWEIRKDVQGLILNCAGFEDEDKVVSAFSQKVNLPVAAILPHDSLIPKMEIQGVPFMNAEGGDAIKKAYSVLADFILSEHESHVKTPCERKEFYALIEELWKEKQT